MKKLMIQDLTPAAATIVLLVTLGVSADAQWLNYKTPGAPRTPDGKVNLAAPVPRTPDGKPDLSGTRESEGGYFGNLAKDLKPGELAMQPWAETQVAENQRNLHKNDPMVACLPPGVPRINLGGNRTMPHPFKIVQTPSLTLMLYEIFVDYRQIHTDGRPLPPDRHPAWFGYSIGRWESDTFIVQTVGINDRTWLDDSGYPHSDQLVITERIRRQDFGHMTIEFTFDDPKMYTKPWTVTVPFELMPDTELLEYVCENEKDLEHMPFKQNASQGK